ncbi:unnamed protein product [Lupinus luteus]|uniref:Uncharacterized protein n=1 Tax=Lupinus luteus TaxID=3873 RepID=A0AAV1WTQ5_LUPLU
MDHLHGSLDALVWGKITSMGSTRQYSTNSTDQQQLGERDKSTMLMLLYFHPNRNEKIGIGPQCIKTRLDTVRTQSWHGQPQAQHTPSCSSRQLSRGVCALGVNLTPGQISKHQANSKSVRSKLLKQVLSGATSPPSGATRQQNLDFKQP